MFLFLMGFTDCMLGENYENIFYEYWWVMTEENELSLKATMEEEVP